MSTETHITIRPDGSVTVETGKARVELANVALEGNVHGPGWKIGPSGISFTPGVQVTKEEEGSQDQLSVVGEFPVDTLVLRLPANSRGEPYVAEEHLTKVGWVYRRTTAGWALLDPRGLSARTNYIDNDMRGWIRRGQAQRIGRA